MFLKILKLKLLHLIKGKNESILGKLSMTLHGKSLKPIKLLNQAPKQYIFFEFIAKFRF